MKKPIGIFDSGVGGLTVFKEVRKQFPFEDIIYFGDTARVPYGPKSRNTVIDYSIQNARFLVQQGAKIIVVACNTSSSVALKKLQKMLDVPILGVIQPGANSAVKNTKNKRIGVIGTEGTIRSDAYKEAIQLLDTETKIFSKACPLLVPLVEEGWINHKITKATIEEYLLPLMKKNIDTLVLGCTHYPILKQTIQSIIGNEINLIDSAFTISQKLQNIVSESNQNQIGKDKFFVSDNEEKFRKIANNILQKKIEPLWTVKLGESWYF